MPYAEILGLRIHYHAPRDPGTRHGQRVLYVHGTGCNAAVWDDHMTAVADAHTPVAIDLPGHGESPGHGFRGVGDYTYFVVELTKALGWDRFVIAGHSLGGAIALLTAIHHAELLDGLILVDTGARLRVARTLLRDARAAAEAGRALATERSWGFADATAQSLVDAVQKLIAGTDPAVTYQDWVADDTFDVMSRLKEVQVPTLAICGAQDRLTPVKYHQFLAAQIPGCQLTVVEGASHWMFWEKPEVFTQAVRSFLDSLPERR